MSDRLRILLSAYACDASDGSEPGMGWYWALEIARLGHEVHILTRENNLPRLKRDLALHAELRIHPVGYDLPRWMRGWKKKGRGTTLYYSLWQRGACRAAHRLAREIPFDLVHHITFAVFRQPSLLGRLGIPLVLGPLGGGEETPPRLLCSYPLRGMGMDSLRFLANLLARFDPLVRQSFRQATVILCKTNETLAYVPPDCRSKCVMMQDVATEAGTILQVPYAFPRTPRFLFVGRLLYWKGIHLALQALAQMLKEFPDARLTIVGNGRDEKWLHVMADHLNIGHAVEWKGWVPREAALDLYRQHTAFLFPSLHDSGGTVVMEALSQGLPLICLDCGGPGAMLLSSCGFKIAVDGRSQEKVIDGLADAMCKLAANPELRAEMSTHALRTARENTWGHVVARAYRQIEETLRNA
jgi:glycosyltransferase involved in cell wall biosynthesis